MHFALFAAQPAPTLPPAGKVLVIAGQDSESIHDYIHSVCDRGSKCRLPAGWAFYTTVRNLTGVDTPHANEPGDNHQDLRYILGLSGKQALQVGLYVQADDLQAVSEGRFDSNLDRLASIFIEQKRRVYLRFGYEFDGPHNAYPPALYVSAYRHVADRLRSRQVPQLAFVWHSWGELDTFGNDKPIEWYPGDEYVDWVGISYFRSGAEAGRERILAIARSKRLPVMICESSAVRQTSQEKVAAGQAYWEQWYMGFFRFIASNPEVRALCIINCNWDAQAQFRKLSWGDGRLSADPVVLQNWRAKMRESAFLNAQ